LVAESCGYGGCTFPKAILAMVRRKSVMVVSVLKSCSKGGYSSANSDGDRLRWMHLPEGNPGDGGAQISHGGLRDEELLEERIPFGV
jgi:hypothetical protein